MCKKMIQLVIITTFFLVSFSAAYGKADYAKSYASVLDKYRSFVQAYKAEKLINEDGELAEEFDGDPWAIMSGEMDGVKGYALKDLSGDDIPELLLLSKDDNNLTIQAIFYLAGKEPTLLEEFWSRSQCAIGGDGFLYKVGASGAAEVVYEKCKLKPDGSAFEVLESIQMTSYNAETEELMTDSEGEPVVKYYHTVGDNKPTEITEAEFDKLIEQWPDDNGPAKLEFTGV